MQNKTSTNLHCRFLLACA